MINSRNQILDIMKGIGIVLVVITHAMARHSVDIANLNFISPAYNMIHSFYMPMFILLSGYLVYNKVYNIKYTNEKVIKFLVPMLVFLPLYWIFGTRSPNGVVFPNVINLVELGKFYGYELVSGMWDLVTWFLWTLMLCYIIVFIFENINKLERIASIPMWIKIIILVAILNAMPMTWLNFNTIKWYGTFFFIGYLIRHTIINNKYKILVLIDKYIYLSIPLFILVGWLTNWMIPYQQSYGFSGYTSIAYTITSGLFSFLGITFLMAILGIGVIYSISKFIVKIKGFNKAFVYLGVSSLGIYLIHILFMRLMNNYWITSIVGLGISILLYELVKRWEWSNFLFLGGGRFPRIVADKIATTVIKEEEIQEV